MIQEKDCDKVLALAFKTRNARKRLKLTPKAWHNYTTRFADGKLSFGKKLELLNLMQQIYWRLPDENKKHGF
jgi:hypothetical protein